MFLKPSLAALVVIAGIPTAFAAETSVTLAPAVQPFEIEEMRLAQETMAIYQAMNSVFALSITGGSTDARPVLAFNFDSSSVLIIDGIYLAHPQQLTFAPG